MNLDLNQIIYTLVIGGVAGWLASLFRGNKNETAFTNIAVGLVGGFIGKLFSDITGLSIGVGEFGDIAIAFIGAVILLSFLAIIRN